ncbi:MAG: glycosyltransferase family 2 protein [Candidatus Moranbacteria bacterium]|nr:glycosyltransferase family 2 protein [Candidatus Moranbacteria bacterium]
MNEYFNLFKNIAFFFATAMLVKYYLFLLLTPLYPMRESMRRIRLKKLRKIHGRAYLPLVSVIVPAWNERVGILKTIKSILRNSYKNIEIIVVNDGSTDDSDAVVKEFIRKNLENRHLDSTKVKYFYKENGGKGEALNFGIGKVSGEIIVTVDADSALERRAIANLVEYFEDDKIDAVVGNVRVAKNHSMVGYTQRLEYLFGFYFKRAHSVLGAEYIFGGACAAFRKATVFDRLGLFDTSNKTEDIEMSMRIRFNGLRSAYAENVICYTEGASTVVGLISQRLRWKKGRMDTFLKYRRMFFSTDWRNHNIFLAWFILPFSILAEIQLFFEPISITFLASYSFISGDYLSITLGALFVFVIYLVNAFFAHDGVSLRRILLFPFTWPLFYFLVWVEYLVLLKSFKMVLRGDDVEWQKWKRTGVTDTI